jgi:hypothetical protein
MAYMAKLLLGICGPEFSQGFKLWRVRTMPEHVSPYLGTGSAAGGGGGGGGGGNGGGGGDGGGGSCGGLEILSAPL